MNAIDRNKLAVLIPSFGGGGAERAMILFAEGVKERGLDVDVVVSSGIGPLREVVRPDIKIVSLGAPRMRNAIIPLAKYLKEVRPAALYATIQHANVAAIIARRVSGVPTKIIVRQSTSHLSELPKNRVQGIMGGVIPWMYGLADGVIAVSEGVREQLNRRNNLLDVRVLPNPVLTPTFDQLSSETIEHPWFTDDAPPVVIGVGRLRIEKGFDILIRSFAEVLQHVECRLVILGEGVEREALEQLTRELGLEDHVNLAGFFVNPLPFMKRARVFVLSSHYEGMPNSLLQAIACGTAVVSTDCESGPREILGGGERGRLISVGDADAMAEAIVEALRDGPHPDAAHFVRTNFSVTQTVSSYLEMAGLH